MVAGPYFYSGKLPVETTAVLVKTKEISRKISESYVNYINQMGLKKKRVEYRVSLYFKVALSCERELLFLLQTINLKAQKYSPESKVANRRALIMFYKGYCF